MTVNVLVFYLIFYYLFFVGVVGDNVFSITEN
jgi:hypothetical protein